MKTVLLVLAFLLAASAIIGLVCYAFVWAAIKLLEIASPWDDDEEVEEAFHYFTCPECGEHYFGTHSGPAPAFEVIARHCNDQFSIGCRWSGSDDRCMNEQPLGQPAV